MSRTIPPAASPAAVRFSSRSRRSHSRAIAEHARRAARAETAPRRTIPWHFLGWLGGRLLALALLGASSYVLYDLASSDHFHVQSVRAHGNRLLSQAEVETIAAVDGANAFWVNTREIQARFDRQPLVQHAQVTVTLPGTVDVDLTERQPAAVWDGEGQSFLIDRDGLVLESAGNAPSDLDLSALPHVAQAEGDPPQPGQKVDPATLAASQRLATLLPEAGITPVAFEWGHDRGLEVPTSAGWRVRFDGSGDLPSQVASLQAIRDYLRRSKQSAHLIDVRFGDRPYFR